MREHDEDTIDHDIAIQRGPNGPGPNGMETGMCTTTHGTLTLAAMLRDPLIEAVMRSDGVSPDDFAALMFRVRDSLSVRAWSDAPKRDVVEAW